MHLWMLKCSSAGSGTQQLWQLRVPPWNSWEQEDWYIVKHNGETVRISHWNLDLMSLVVWKVPFALRNMKSNAKGRCANTGKWQSCGQKGDLPQKPDSWKHGSMEGDIPTASTRHDAAHRPDWSSAGAVALELSRSRGTGTQEVLPMEPKSWVVLPGSEPKRWLPTAQAPQPTCHEQSCGYPIISYKQRQAYLLINWLKWAGRLHSKTCACSPNSSCQHCDWQDRSRWTKDCDNYLQREELLVVWEGLDLNASTTPEQSGHRFSIFQRVQQ